MYDRKVVRRRRAALAVFVGPVDRDPDRVLRRVRRGLFHTLQRGAQEAFAPIESGASRALKPVRDLFGWAGDTFEAKRENKELRGARSSGCAPRSPSAQTAQRDAAQLQGLVGLREEDGFPRGTEPITARVIARSPTIWYSSVKIDKGAGDGMQVDQPVIAAGATRRRAAARRQGHERDRRHRRGQADHGRLERRLGPGHALRAPRESCARPWATRATS